MLDRDTILNVPDTPREVVEVPEWNGSVYVPVLSLAGLDELAKLQRKTENSNALMAVRIIQDEYGNRVFTDADAPALAQKSGKAVLRILKKFNEVNGLAEGAAEQAAKN